ncbi:hypothetical protein [Streptomyces hoynatensis]|uniref:Uncharacterized protein n=1 Tax=Streptomyces hoynatensis TaxID=1141874 RepID=A0A3A9YMB5_9ACTN|nr:hypothetical protein [Streptomyces hoynatensis]RKN35927.1 hypothetical protein D7294_30315 [Streptomyces hoynatensis]
MSESIKHGHIAATPMGLSLHYVRQIKKALSGHLPTQGDSTLCALLELLERELRHQDLILAEKVGE